MPNATAFDGSPVRGRGLSRLSALIDRVVPAGLGDETQHRRARVLVATSMLAILAVLPPAAFRWWAGVSRPELVQHAVVLAAFVSTPVLLRWTRSVTIAGSFMLGWALVLTLFVAIGYNDLEFVVSGWFTVIAMVAIFFLGPRAGLAIVASSMMAVAAVYAWRSSGSASLTEFWPGFAPGGIDIPNKQFLALVNVELSIALAAVMASIYNRELRHEAASVLRRERDFRRLTDTLAAGVFVTRGGTIVHGNAAGARLVGVSHRDLVGVPLFEVLQVAGVALRSSSSTDNAETRVVRFEGRDDRTRTVDLASMPIEWEGRRAVLHTAFDLTEREWEAQERAKLEAQVRHSQKLETVGLLAGGIAHDFNNILQTILANTEMLELASTDTPPEERERRQLERIRIAATRGAELVDQMLAYAGRGQARIEEIEISALVREVVQLASAAMSKKAEVCFELEDELPAISADATQIRQVVMNLVTNAGDAVGDEVGRVTIRTGVRQLGPQERASVFVAGDMAPGRYVYVEVQDDGCGIEMSEVSKIFDPFFTTKTRGRGLGLAAVLGIVRAHGGNLEVQSGTGEGARFRIYLPALEGVQPRVHPTSEGLGLGPRAAHVLIADDEREILESVSESLRDRGYTVTTVPDGKAAVAAVSSAKNGRAFDVVVLDMAMPRMDGAEALRAIHQLSPGLPAILSTGYAHGHERMDLDLLGFSDMLRKPYRGRDLVRAIDRVLGVPTTPRPHA